MKKKPRLKLSQHTYAKLRLQALDRDLWRCQICGTAVNLQVHHLRRRSRFGYDELKNLITLCIDCHRQQH